MEERDAQDFPSGLFQLDYMFNKKNICIKTLKILISLTINYVLVDYKCDNIIVFLGNNADTEQIKMALSAAERFSKTVEVEDAWRHVRVY